MNTPEQPSGDNHVKVVGGTPNVAAPPPAPPRSLIHFLRAHWHIEVVILLLASGVITLIFYQLRNVRDPAFRQASEGFGIAICMITYFVIFVRRLTRFLAKDEQREEAQEEAEALAAHQKDPQETQNKLVL